MAKRLYLNDLQTFAVVGLLREQLTTTAPGLCIYTSPDWDDERVAREAGLPDELVHLVANLRRRSFGNLDEAYRPPAPAPETADPVARAVLAELVHKHNRAVEALGHSLALGAEPYRVALPEGFGPPVPAEAS